MSNNVPETIMVDQRVTPQMASDDVIESRNGNTDGMVEYMRVDVVAEREKQFRLAMDEMKQEMHLMQNRVEPVGISHQLAANSDYDVLTVVLSDGTIRQGVFDGNQQQYRWKKVDSNITK